MSHKRKFQRAKHEVDPTHQCGKCKRHFPFPADGQWTCPACGQVMTIVSLDTALDSVKDEFSPDDWEMLQLILRGASGSLTEPEYNRLMELGRRAKPGNESED